MPVFTLPKSSHPDFAVPGVKPKGPVEIDWGSLPQTLVSFIYTDNAGGRSLINEGITSVATTGTAANYSVNQGAVVMDCGVGASDYVLFTGPDTNISTSNGITAAVTFYATSIQDWAEIVVYYDSAGGTGGGNARVGIGTDNGGKLFFAHNDTWLESFNIDFPLNEWATAVATMDSSGGITLTLYTRSGGVQTDSGQTCTVQTMQREQIMVGAGGGDVTTRYMDGFVSHAWIAEEIWPQAKISNYCENSYGFLEPAIPLTYFMPAEEAAQYFTFELPKSHHPDFALPNVKPTGPVKLSQNSINQGLISCVLNKAIDLRTGIVGTTFLDASRVRNDISFNAGDDESRVEYGKAALTNPDILTLETIVTIRASKSLIMYWGAGTYNGIESGSTGKQRAILDFNSRVYYWDGITAWDTAYDISNLTDGLPHQLTFVLNAAGTYFYVDGVEKANTTATTTGTGLQATATFKAGSSHASGTTSGDFDFHLGLFWDRALSVGEIQERADHRYGSILEPAIPLTYFVPAAAAAGGEDEIFLMLLGVGS